MTKHHAHIEHDDIGGSAASSLPHPRSEISQALRSCRRGLVGIAWFSGTINVLMLTGAFFMLQVYDRVLPSRSVSTLVALALIAAVLFLAQGVLDAIRMRLLARIGTRLDEALSARTFDAIIRLPLRVAPKGDGLLPLRDLDSVRTFLSGQGPAALFDLPWMPIYLAIIFLFHPLLGVVATIGALALAGFTALTHALTSAPTHKTTEIAAVRNGLAANGRQNAEAVAAMGMAKRSAATWSEANSSFLASNQRVTDIVGGFGAMARTFRMMLQSAGIIIAGSILVSRALAPVDLAIANWRGLVAARQSWRRLGKLLALLPEHANTIDLPAPTERFSVENVGVVPPGQTDSVVHNISFSLSAGQGLGIVGPSGSGKSSLARALVNAWQPARGSIRLDGASLTQWQPEALGRHVGYLPQSVELLDGSIAANISRFEPDAQSSAIITAAKAADVHELIVSLPEGYDTQLGAAGQIMSAGQRQRVALARALYGQPFLLVLDEPNSNLDAEGEAALNRAIRAQRARGGIAIVIAHRKGALAEVDTLLVMAGGTTAAFGDKETVMAKSLRAAADPNRPRRTRAAAGAGR